VPDSRSRSAGPFGPTTTSGGSDRHAVTDQRGGLLGYRLLGKTGTLSAVSAQTNRQGLRHDRTPSLSVDTRLEHGFTPSCRDTPDIAARRTHGKVTMKVTATAVLEAAKSMEEAATLLRRIALDLGGGHDATLIEAVEALSDPALELVEYVIDHRGRVDYHRLLDDLDRDPRNVGGILSGITKKAIDGIGGVLVLDEKERRKSWDVVCHAKFHDAARAVITVRLGERGEE
jgi:hypothetical protein